MPAAEWGRASPRDGYGISEAYGSDHGAAAVPDLDPVANVEPPGQNLLAGQCAGAAQGFVPRGLGVGQLDPVLVAGHDVVMNVEKE